MSSNGHILVAASNESAAFLRGRQVLVDEEQSHHELSLEADGSSESGDGLGERVLSDGQDEVMVVVKDEEERPWSNHRLHGRQTRKVEHSEEELESWMQVISNFAMTRREKYALLQHMCCAGVPQCFRGMVWKLLAGYSGFASEEENEYERLKQQEAEDEGAILRDVGRTFPEYKQFAEEDGPGQRSIQMILRAFSNKHPKVGYVQGMNFIVAVLLMYSNEEDAFWLFEALMVDHGLMGIYKEGHVQLKQYHYQLEKLVEAREPELIEHLRKESIEVSMISSEWFLTLFIYNFPLQSVWNVWDMLFLEGELLLLKLAAGLMTSSARVLTELTGEDIIMFLKMLPSRYEDPSRLMELVERSDVTKKEIEEHGLEFREKNMDWKRYVVHLVTFGAGGDSDSDEEDDGGKKENR